MTEEVLDWKEAIARVLNKRDMYVKLLAKFIETERDTPSKVLQALKAGNMEEARKYHYLLLPIMHTLLNMGNPSGIKAVLHVKGLIQHVFRLPVHPVNEAKFAEIIKAVELTEKNCKAATL